MVTGWNAGCKNTNTQKRTAARKFRAAVLCTHDQKGEGRRVFVRAWGAGGLFAADGCEASFQIGDDVINVLGADGQADGVLIDLLLGQLLIVQLAVGGGGRVDDQTLHVCNVCQQGEDLQVVNELEGFFAAALDVEGKMDAPPLGKYFSYRA